MKRRQWCEKKAGMVAQMRDRGVPRRLAGWPKWERGCEKRKKIERCDEKVGLVGQMSERVREEKRGV